MSPKEIAEKIREWADLVSWAPQKKEMLSVADEIDPPKPQRPKPGTVVRHVDGGLGFTDRDGIHWVGSGEHLAITRWEHEAAHRWKPVHILADDEVAVKRSELLKLANGERLLEESAYDSGEVGE